MVDLTVHRISGLLNQLARLFANSHKNDWIARQLGIILEAIKEEIDEDPELFAHPASKEWIIKFSTLMEWTATGDYSKLSDDLIAVACEIDGIAPPVNRPDSEYLEIMGQAARH